jgi:hypothetical protein
MFRSIPKVLAGVAAVAALALGGSAIAGAASSSSAGTSSAGTTTSGTPSSKPPANFPAPGTAAHEDAEKPVTGDSAAKAQAAAIKSVGGGTAGAVTTDFTGRGFEVTVTKTDGSKVDVHLDSSYRVMQGPGGHGGMHPAGVAPPPGRGAPPAGQGGPPPAGY